MHQGPEAGVVKVVDMAIRLSPAQVIPNGPEVWVRDHSPIKGRCVLQLGSWKETAPVGEVAHSEMGYHTGQYFAAVRETPCNVSQNIVTTVFHYTLQTG